MATPTVHRYNKEYYTSGKKVARNVFKFTIGASGAVGVVSQAMAGLISSVVRTAVGVYTVTLTKPYHTQKLLLCDAKYAGPAAGSAGLEARYRAGSFSATAGTFIIDVVTPVAIVATDPASGSEIMVDLAYQISKVLTD